MKKISVIVPVYNTEKYISRCLDHLLNQTYKNIEIIVIDDGSTDNSANIVKEYADKYDNIIFIQNEENKKTFETKRIGMEVATGDYIGFCDSDDYFEFEAYEYMINRIQEKDYDMVTINDDKEYNKKEHSYYNKELFYSLINQGERYFMQVSLFKKEVVTKALSDVNHYIKAAHGEDHLWRLIILYYVNSSLHTTEKLFFYTSNPDSVTKSNNIEKLIERVCDDSVILSEMKAFLINKNIPKNYIISLIKNIYIFPLKAFNLLKSVSNNYMDIWSQYASDDMNNSLINYYDNEINKYKNEINKYKNEINKYKIIENKINIADILFSISKDNSYIVFMIIGIKIKIKKDNFVKKVSWWIPVKKWRNNFRTKFK